MAYNGESYVDIKDVYVTFFSQAAGLFPALTVAGTRALMSLTLTRADDRTTAERIIESACWVMKDQNQPEQKELCKEFANVIAR